MSWLSSFEQRGFVYSVAVLFAVGGVVGAVEGELAQRGELAFEEVIHEEFVGVQAISALLAAARCPTRLSFLAERCGLKLSQTIAIRICGGCRLRM
jgi:hypothetical protein